ncbi:MAG TPA: PQQ-binding-like beta-propeller repeat protein [Anaerolineales bacterium]|nr:PQQ-binding-like beta-propeller repeat protein [Anaerolineales bacterium]
MRKKFIIVLLTLLGGVLLSACTGGPVHGSTWPGLAADEDTAYLADGPFVYAINLRDGREIWRYPGEGGGGLAFYSTPAITSDGLVIVGSAGTNYSLVALDSNNVSNNVPAEAWRFTEANDHWRAAPLVVEDKLFAANSDGNLYILNVQDGRSETVVNLDGRLWSQPVSDGERVYVTSLDHSVIAVDVNTYEVLWRQDLGGAVPGSAVLAEDGTLYVGSLASQLERFDPATGNHQPLLDAENWVWSTPALEGDTLYFSDVDGNFYSVDTATGSLNWTVRPDGPVTASPLVQDDHILLATESGFVYAVDRDGNIVWSQQVGGKIYTTPIVAGDLILVAPLETEFYLAALDENGRQVWTFTPGE